MQYTHFINDVELEIEYSATPYIPANWHHDQEGGEVEIESICIDGNDVMEMLADWVIDQCVKACEEAAPEAFAAAKEDSLIELAEKRYADQQERDMP